MAPGAKPTTVGEFLDRVPAAGQAHARAIFTVLDEVAVGAVVGLKWSQPTWDLHRILYAFNAFKDHANVMPGKEAIRALAAEIEAAGFEHTEGVLMLPYSRPVPEALLRRLADHRYRDLVDHDAKFAV